MVGGGVDQGHEQRVQGQFDDLSIGFCLEHEILRCKRKQCA